MLCKMCFIGHHLLIIFILLLSKQHIKESTLKRDWGCYTEDRLLARLAIGDEQCLCMPIR